MLTVVNKERPPSPPKQEKTAASTGSKDKGKGGAKGKDKGKDKDQKGSRPSSQQFDHSKPHWSLRIASDASSAVNTKLPYIEVWVVLSLFILSNLCSKKYWVANEIAMVFLGRYWSEERYRESGRDPSPEKSVGKCGGRKSSQGRVLNDMLSEYPCLLVLLIIMECNFPRNTTFYLHCKVSLSCISISVFRLCSPG